jgi:hypothetical protein
MKNDSFSCSLLVVVVKRSVALPLFALLQWAICLPSGLSSFQEFLRFFTLTRTAVPTHPCNVGSSPVTKSRSLPLLHARTVIGSTGPLVRRRKRLTFVRALALTTCALGRFPPENPQSGPRSTDHMRAMQKKKARLLVFTSSSVFGFAHLYSMCFRDLSPHAILFTFNIKSLTKVTSIRFWIPESRSCND